jgi:transcriptional regulator with XRE-family HTH domain
MTLPWNPASFSTEIVIFFLVMGTSFRENLRVELDYLNLTVKELSAKTGIAKKTLDCYLAAKATMPPADTAVRIANALSVSVEYLVTGKKDEKRTPPPANHTIRSIIQVILTLNAKDNEILLELAKILKKQAS